MGYLNSEYFLGGQMVLNRELAEGAVGEFARELDMDCARTVLGIHDLVNENMANAARVHAAERGIDLMGYVLVTTGGAGPVHACGVATRLGIDRIIVPPSAGVASAFGLMLAPIAFDYARSLVTRLEGLDLKKVNGLFAEMEREGRALVTGAGVDDADIQFTRTADMRYVGQGHEIRVPVSSGKLSHGAVDVLQEAFDAVYRRIYGRICDGVPVEAIHWRVTVSGPIPDIGEAESVFRPQGTALKGHRDVLFDFETGTVSVPVYDRYLLAEDIALKGPAIVEEAESTTVVAPGWSLCVGQAKNLVLCRENS
jgi:N-methylhydantoinase A